jgi:hypothetical protein
MRHSLLVVGLCCLVVLAGCGGTSTQPTPTPSPTGSAAPDGGDGGGGGSDGGDGSDGADGGGGGSDGGDGGSTAFSYPAGTSESGVADPTALLDAKVDSLADTDYALNVTQVAMLDGSRTRSVSVVRSDLDGQRSLGEFSVTSPSGETTVDIYRNATTLSRRQAVDGRTSYRVRNGSGTFEQYHERRADVARSAESLFRFANLSGAEVVERDGRTMARYTLAEVNGSAVNESTTITDATGVLLVDERGVIHRGVVDIRGNRDGTPRRLFIELRTTATSDVTVEEPDWLSEAEAASEG